MKTVFILLLSCVSVFGSPLSVTGYNGITSQSPVKQGCISIIITPRAFTGTIGNANWVGLTTVFSINARQNGDRLSDLSYTVATPTLSIIEVR